MPLRRLQIWCKKMKKIIPIAMLAAFLTGGCTTSSRFIPISACQKDQNEPSGSSLEERSSFFVVEHPGRQNLADYLKFEFNISDMSRDVIKLGGYYVDFDFDMTTKVRGE